jgi:ATP-dependent helicase HrpA
MIIAAALSIQDPRERPRGKEQLAAEAHNRFRDPHSDFLSYLTLWDHLRSERDNRSSSAFRRMCKAEYLNYLRVREWQDLHVQLRQVGRTIGLRGRRASGEVDRDGIHRSLLAGLLSHVGLRDPDRREYVGARNARFAVPGAKRSPKWIMVAELVETNRLWGRVAAPVRPEWVEQAGAHLVKRSYGDPRWDERRAAATVEEQVTLFGLPIVVGRQVAYDRIDPADARELFLRHALVAGQWSSPHGFRAENARRMSQVRALEERVRRRNLLVDDEELVRLYDERVPERVTTGARFDRWWRDARRKAPDLLTFSFEELVDPDAGPVRLADYPDEWLGLPVHYRFEPGHELDGATVDVPLAQVARLRAAPFGWHVPGHRRELVTALLRSVPKTARRQLDAAAVEAERFLDECGPHDGPLLDVLSTWVTRRTGEAVIARTWDLDLLPEHLRVTFRALDERGRPLAWSKDLGALASHVRPRLADVVARATEPLERSGLTDWPEDGLRRRVGVQVGDERVDAFPALVADGDTVGVRVFPTASEQAQAMWVGTRRLLLLRAGNPIRDIQRRLPKHTTLGLARSSYATVAELLADCLTASADSLLREGGGPAWDVEAFRRLEAQVRTRLVDTAVSAADATASVVSEAARLEERMSSLTSPALHDSLVDLQTQVARLVHPGFVRAAGLDRLADIQRYLAAAAHRLDKLPGDVSRDRTLLARIEDVELAFSRARTLAPDVDLRAVRWMIEELRVSLFAQHLGTAQSVSEQRILRELAKVA